jgi:hypothetical protein
MLPERDSLTRSIEAATASGDVLLVVVKWRDREREREREERTPDERRWGRAMQRDGFPPSSAKIEKEDGYFNTKNVQQVVTLWVELLGALDKSIPLFSTVAVWIALPVRPIPIGTSFFGALARPITYTLCHCFIKSKISVPRSPGRSVSSSFYYID